jgi:hypothetical protein
VAEKLFLRGPQVPSAPKTGRSGARYALFFALFTILDPAPQLVADGFGQSRDFSNTSSHAFECNVSYQNHTPTIKITWGGQAGKNSAT